MMENKKAEKHKCFTCGRVAEGKWETIRINPKTDEIQTEWICDDCLNENDDL